MESWPWGFYVEGFNVTTIFAFLVRLSPHFLLLQTGFLSFLFSKKYSLRQFQNLILPLGASSLVAPKGKPQDTHD